GEVVKAFVVPAEGVVLDENEVIHHCEARLARYKCPEVIDVVAELPRGGVVGKLRRRELR
ncbi:MAG: o-succinylbenzoate--CoA ligase, partial [Acidimicrobiales bacterium]